MVVTRFQERQPGFAMAVRPSQKTNTVFTEAARPFVSARKVGRSLVNPREKAKEFRNGQTSES